MQRTRRVAHYLRLHVPFVRTRALGLLIIISERARARAAVPHYIYHACNVHLNTD